MVAFSVIKKDQEYWLADQIKMDMSKDEYWSKLKSLLKDWKDEQVNYLSLLMVEEYEQQLMNEGFHKVSSIVEYTRLLDENFTLDDAFHVVTLSGSSLADEEFALLYDKCRSGSANKNNLFSIEQIMEAFVNELGSNWRHYCHIFFKGEEPMGISIPHIEDGTVEEGRLFYFGVVPEQRGKGFGKVFHLYSLELLKKMNATYYVGSTDENNEYMIRIFQANGCILRDKKGIYRIDK
ncbi:GNAT family N-acetyltransferase [Psychrobacillus sp. Sa2BUA9]|uniref:GNAT family N-acetyltransferase n=1 Tax=Psychrobacillus faecigallinarum TaxID=2762235 RepID=A0ABR8RBA9_9BACI|nr:GNAT family N-acetyltransferase [Psychrobacillus faecigallinarum]MBD7944937.1 GNAT family N-acetyltransferase [Psychrobacillus faecigallinarum]